MKFLGFKTESDQSCYRHFRWIEKGVTKNEEERIICYHMLKYIYFSFIFCWNYKIIDVNIPKWGETQSCKRRFGEVDV